MFTFFNLIKKYKGTFSLISVLIVILCVLLFIEESFFTPLLPKKDYQTLKIEKINELKNNPIKWVLKEKTGEIIKFSSYRGNKSIVVNLWASWCAPCIEELPALFKLAQKTKSHNVVLAVTTEPLDKINQFLQNSFPELDSQIKFIVLNKKEKEKYFFQEALPVTYLFNKKGYLDRKVIGAKNWSNSYWIQYIRNL